MSSINKVILIGILGKDPEVRNTTKGDVVANFSIATSEDYKDKEGNKVSYPEWHHIACFKYQAEFVRDYVRKGFKVYIEGKIKSEKYQNKDGTERHSTKIYADVVRNLTPKGSSSNNKESEGFYDGVPL